MLKTADRLGISLSTVQRVKIENRVVVKVIPNTIYAAMAG